MYPNASVGNVSVPMGKELQGPFQLEASSPMNIINFLLIFIISQLA
jgi:hypothetical protein